MLGRNLLSLQRLHCLKHLTVSTIPRTMVHLLQKLQLRTYRKKRSRKNLAIALGLTKCKLSNIPLVKGITETKDIEDRDKINDAS